MTEQTREEAMVILRRDGDGRPTVWCDPEIADLIDALNNGALATVASCSGHGLLPGRISLVDGRELFVVNSFEEAAEMEGNFMALHGKIEALAKTRDDLREALQSATIFYDAPDRKCDAREAEIIDGMSAALGKIEANELRHCDDCGFSTEEGDAAVCPDARCRGSVG